MFQSIWQHFDEIKNDTKRLIPLATRPSQNYIKLRNQKKKKKHNTDIRITFRKCIIELRSEHYITLCSQKLWVPFTMKDERRFINLRIFQFYLLPPGLF